MARRNHLDSWEDYEDLGPQNFKSKSKKTLKSTNTKSTKSKTNKKRPRIKKHTEDNFDTERFNKNNDLSW